MDSGWGYNIVFINDGTPIFVQSGKCSDYETAVWSAYKAVQADIKEHKEEVI